MKAPACCPPPPPPRARVCYSHNKTRKATVKGVCARTRTRLTCIACCCRFNLWFVDSMCDTSTFWSFPSLPL